MKIRKYYHCSVRILSHGMRMCLCHYTFCGGGEAKILKTCKVSNFIKEAFLKIDSKELKGQAEAQRDF